MRRGWIAGAAILLLLFASAEVIYHLRGNGLAVEVAAVCVLLVAMFACFRIAKWADAVPKSEREAVSTESIAARVSPDTDPEPLELLLELRALGYQVHQENGRWVVSDPNGAISLYYSSNQALRDDADALRKRSSRSNAAEA